MKRRIIALRSKLAGKAYIAYSSFAPDGKTVLEIESENDKRLHNYIEENGLPDVIKVESLGYFSVIPVKDGGRLAGKIAVITGGAQGIGEGLAKALSDEGAAVVVADMNYEGAKDVAGSLENATAVQVNVTDEQSVARMYDTAVMALGGVDIAVANAGIAIAGSLDEMTKDCFEKITAVNYTGYFLTAKYASDIMKIQHEYTPDAMYDIIQINSKSGIAGSNKNFAYSGSKFGGIGITQSIALELAPYNIKVNAVCPGNFLDGPLWSDPEKGLFVQFLKAGKIPGAKTVDDVRKAYESKVPLGRGCRVKDIARAVLYICEQEYETGQVLPVTGGQETLN